MKRNYTQHSAPPPLLPLKDMAACVHIWEVLEMPPSLLGHPFLGDPKLDHRGFFFLFLFSLVKEIREFPPAARFRDISMFFVKKYSERGNVALKSFQTA